MRIFIIWLSLICCSVANGLFYANFGSPEKFVFMGTTLIVCGVLLYIHRRITKKWEAPLDIWTPPYRFPIFRVTASLCVFLLMILAVLILSGISLKTEILVAVVTMCIASVIACNREKEYTLNYWV